MKKFLMPIATFLLASAALVSCGNNSVNNGGNEGDNQEPQPVAKTLPAIQKSYIASSKVDNIMGQGSFLVSAYEVTLFEENIYQYVETEIKYAYSMLLGTTVKVAYGDYTLGTAEDGVLPITLKEASEVFVNGNSKAGGFSIYLNSVNAEYPVEMIAKGQGEKNMANSKADLIAEYGQGSVIYAEEDKNVFSFTTEDHAEKQVVSEKSSSKVSELLASLDKFQINSSLDINFKEEKVVDDGGNPVLDGEGNEKTTKVLNTFSAVTRILGITTENAYEYFESEVKYGYSMLLATTTVHNFGKVTKGDSEDGYTNYALAAADEVYLNSFSKAGGFNIAINTRNAEYPVELPAKSQGEKNMANAKADVVAAYGPAVEYYLSDSTHTFEVSNPADE